MLASVPTKIASGQVGQMAVRQVPSDLRLFPSMNWENQIGAA